MKQIISPGSIHETGFSGLWDDPEEWDGEVSGREGEIEKRNEKSERARRRERETKHNDFSDIKASIWCQFVKIFL